MLGILNQTRKDLSKVFYKCGLSESHIKPFMGAVYKDLNSSPFHLSFMPSKAKSFAFKFHIYEPEIASIKQSKEDLSHKFILRLQDNREIETVLIPEKNRLTLCLSSQVGCRQKCVFCYTGKMGLLRNLTTEEIISQVMVVNKWLSKKSKRKEQIGSNSPFVSNIVFMGMGEPLDNMKALLPAIAILKDPWGLNIAPRRITVSTAGHLDGLEELITSDLNVSLALSLHASNNKLRSKLMPISRTNSMDNVLSLMEKYAVEKKRKIFIQYTLFAGLNDNQEEALSLVNLLKNRPFKVNLIPFNEVEFSRLRRPELSSIKNFQEILLRGGIRTTIRFSKGRDILAACGQLNPNKDS